jgi:hypothetical protein
MGLAKTIGDDMGHPRIGSNKTPTIQSLRNFINTMPILIKPRTITKMDIVRSFGERTKRREPNQSGAES